MAYFTSSIILGQNTLLSGSLASLTMVIKIVELFCYIKNHCSLFTHTSCMQPNHNIVLQGRLAAVLHETFSNGIAGRSERLTNSLPAHTRDNARNLYISVNYRVYYTFLRLPSCRGCGKIQ